MISKCYERAKEVIRICSTKNGLFASGGKNGYDAVWARDSIISSLGASLIKGKLFKDAFRNSLITLADNQSKLGQISNAVDKFSKRKPHVDYESIDSSLWYIIGHYVYKSRYKDNSLFQRYNKSLQEAFTWLRYHDPGENGMLAQLPTSDWQDAFPHKYGYTINTQALYYKVLNLIGEKNKARRLKFTVNNSKEQGLWAGKFYLPYRWKNHNKYKEIGDWFDSLGNLLAVVFDLADEIQSRKIISYIKKNKIDVPYPVKAIYPPIRKGSKYWQDYFNDCDAKMPYHYLNGGIWGYIGCFYVIALLKLKKCRAARLALERIAEVNLKGNFPEWTNPLDKKSYGKLQAWEAGMYILAYESVRKNKCLI